MKVEELKKDIYYVGALDGGRKLFDALIPLPDGTSYNSYLIKGSEKTVLIDTVDPAKENVLIKNLKKLKIDKLDYIISQHCEQDHSGTIPTILKLYKDAKVITNAKNKELLKEHLLISEDKIVEIQDGEELSLGNKTLKFIFTPWVHWPETMCTYLKEDKILFSCDFFGSHIAFTDLFVKDKKHVYVAAKRYYAEIMMPFRTVIKSNLKKVEALEIDLIAPSHGSLHNEPSFIMDAYRDWTSDKVKNEVVIPYVSMHGSVAKMVEYLVKALEEKGIVVKAFNLAQMDLGELAMALVDAATVVIATPTVLVRPHPLAVYAAYLTNALRPKTRFASIVGSYGWGGKMPEEIKGLISNLKVELIEPVIAKGYPKEADFKALDELAEKIKNKHKEGEINNG